MVVVTYDEALDQIATPPDAAFNDYAEVLVVFELAP